MSICYSLISPARALSPNYNVDKAHQKALCVFMSVVRNHYGFYIIHCGCLYKAQKVFPNPL